MTASVFSILTLLNVCVLFLKLYHILCLISFLLPQGFPELIILCHFKNKKDFVLVMRTPKARLLNEIEISHFFI
ncbi:hypothetical protein GCM10017706_23410 [Lactococcus lactis subsp. hordniae]